MYLPITCASSAMVPVAASTKTSASTTEADADHELDLLLLPRLHRGIVGCRVGVHADGAERLAWR